jgi:flagellar basal-body rod protein FlgF
MTDAVALSELGMINDLKLLDMISQNLANANTNGYKRSLPIADISVTQFESVLADFAAGVRQQVPIIADHVDGSQGALKFTGNPLDLAIEGAGFFELETSDGVRYTRRGAFALDVNGRLATADGHIVNGLNGEIRLSGTAEPKIDAQGRIWEGENMTAQLKLVRFEDATPLQRVNGGLYVFNGKAASEMSVTGGVRQGHLEASNVTVMDEMVRMITTTRHFETTQKVITGYDEMIGEAISTIAEF